MPIPAILLLGIAIRLKFFKSSKIPFYREVLRFAVEYNAGVLSCSNMIEAKATIKEFDGCMIANARFDGKIILSA